MAASVLCVELNYYLARMMLTLVYPWRVEHGKSLTKNYSRDGALQHAVEMSQKRWETICFGMAASLTSAGVLEKIGSPLRLDVNVMVDIEIFEAVARYSVRLVVSLLGHRIANGLA